jgi:hypothetical protein
LDDLIRVGLALDTSQADQNVRDFGRTIEDGAREVDHLRDRLTSLQRDYRVGGVTALQYASQLRTLKADMAELNQTTRLGEEAQHLLTNAARTTEAQLQRVSGGMNRAAFGVQTLANSMQGGRLSAQALTASLTTLGIGSPEFLLITAGLSFIGNGLFQMGNKGDEAAKKIEDAVDAAMTKMNQLTNRTRIQAIVDRLEAKKRGDIPEGTSNEERIRILSARLNRGTSPLSSDEAATLNAGHRRLEELDRGAQAPRAPRQPSGGRFRGSPLDLSDLPDAPHLNLFKTSPEETKAELAQVQTLFDKAREQELALESEGARRRVTMEERAAAETTAKWEAAAGLVQSGLNTAFDAVLNHQRNVWQSLFSWIEQELARLAAKKIATEVVGGLLGVLSGGFLGGLLRSDSGGGGGGAGGAGPAIAPQVAPSHVVFAPQVNLVSMETGRVTRSFTAEQRRYALRGGSVGPQSRIDIPVAAVVTQRG